MQKLELLVLTGGFAATRIKGWRMGPPDQRRPFDTWPPGKSDLVGSGMSTALHRIPLYNLPPLAGHVRNSLLVASRMLSMELVAGPAPRTLFIEL